MTIDTLRADHLGSYGYPRPVSPFLDRLAADGLRFERAVSSISHTAPSHASILTGLHPAQHRVRRNGETLDPRFETIASVLGRAGLRSAGYPATQFLGGLRSRFDHFKNWKGYQPSEKVLQKALDWIRWRTEDGPYFIWIHLFDVHEWYHDERVNPLALDEVRDFALGGEDLMDFVAEHHGVELAAFPGRTDKLISAHDRYDAQILKVDRALENFFSELESTAPTQNSLWIVTSDHGEGLGSHGFLGHGKYVYNEQLLVPLILRFSDRRYRGRVIDEQVQLVDLAPTLADWFGLELSQPSMAVSGRSLRPLIDGKASWDELAFAQRRPADERRVRDGWRAGEQYSLQSRDLKIILGTDQVAELYRLDQDPLELEDRFDPQSPGVRPHLRQLQKLIDQYMVDGATVGERAIQPEFVEELKALGYL